MSRSEGAIALRRIGKTHEELARILGVSRVAVGNWAGGVRKPMPEHRQRIFERLGIPIEAWDRPAKIGGSPIDRAIAAARHAKETEGVTSPVTSVTSPVTSVTSVTSRIPDGAIPKAVELERMAHGLMSKLLEDQLATPMEQAKVMASVASTLTHLAKLTGEYDLSRRLFRLPLWHRVRKALAEGLKEHPEAAKSVETEPLRWS